MIDVIFLDAGTTRIADSRPFSLVGDASSLLDQNLFELRIREDLRACADAS